MEKTATIQTIRSISHEMATRRDWKTPLAICATIAAVIPLTDWSWSGERMWLSASGWLKIFTLSAFLAFVWALVLGIRNRRRPGLSPEDIYLRIAGDSITELAPPSPPLARIPDSGSGDRGLHTAGTKVRHAHWGLGEVTATWRSGGTDYLKVRFEGPPAHEEEMISGLTSLLRVLPDAEPDSSDPREVGSA